MNIETKRLILKQPSHQDVDKIVDYYRRNQTFLSRYEPERESFFYTRAYQKMMIQSSIDSYTLGTELRFWIELKEAPTLFVGTFAFSNIIMGPFKSCFLGYKGDEAHLRRGYLYEGIEAGIDLLFTAYGLHRVEANIMPRNLPSIQLVEKLGFYQEGTAIKYLQINGVWEDHIHMVKRNVSLE